jgi:hypothetical protein
MRTAILTTEHVIGEGWYGLVSRWPVDNGTLGFRKGCGSRKWWSFGNMITFQNPESVSTCGIFYADLLTIWVDIGIRTYSGTVWADAFALLKAIVCGEGIFEGAILPESLFVHYDERLRAQRFFILLVSWLIILLLVLRACGHSDAYQHS